jgi:SpoIID/LytB domain protein
VAATLGVALPAAPAAADTTFTLNGHGWGHGRGMGQYGAFGYARDHGWTHPQILDHFYGGTTAGSIPAGSSIRVRLTRNRTGLPVDLGEITVTSGVPYMVGNITVDPWRFSTVHRNPDGSWTFQVRDSCTGPVLWETLAFTNGPIYPIGVTDAGSDTAQMLTICNAGGSGENRTYRGQLLQVWDGSGLRTVNTVLVEQYLRSVVPREMPASWHGEALRSQAVAARSYGMAEARYSYAETCSTDSCQVYYGYAGNFGAGLLVYEDSRTNAAIAATENVVRRFPGGAVARTEFSSSTGGYTAGGTFPAVPDLGDSISVNPNHNWTTTLSADAVGARYGIGSAISIDVLSRNGLGDLGGRVLSVRIRGTGGSVTRTGDQFRSDFGLKSDWFAVSGPVPHLEWYLRLDNSAGAPGLQVAYGGVLDTPVTGDWDGNGTDTVGVFSRGGWYLRNANAEGSPALAFAYGGPNDLPVHGDFDGGSGPDGIGVYAGGTFFLRTTPSAGAPELAVPYGWSGVRPVIGDWNGDGVDTIGIFAGGTWYLRNSNTPGPPDIVVNYGATGYVPVVGDWDGNGTDTIGVYVNGSWYLRNSNTGGAPDLAFGYGAAGYVPVVGDHDGDGRDTIGVVQRVV